MPDLSAGFDTPNPYGLLASDFTYDMTSYEVALRFLSDLSSGVIEADALANNGGNPAMLTAWMGSDKFRRVLSKCRAAGRDERDALRAQEKAAEAEAAEDEGNPSDEQFNQFVRLEDVPANRSPFSHNPASSSWGSA